MCGRIYGKLCFHVCACVFVPQFEFLDMLFHVVSLGIFIDFENEHAYTILSMFYMVHKGTNCYQED